MDIVSLTKKSKSQLEGANDIDQLEKAYKSLLGKNGQINKLLKNLRTLPPDQRKKSGQALNQLKNILEEKFQSRSNFFKDKDSSEKLKRENIDVSLPGRSSVFGTIHPVTSTISEICNFFNS